MSRRFYEIAKKKLSAESLEGLVWAITGRDKVPKTLSPRELDMVTRPAVVECFYKGGLFEGQRACRAEVFGLLKDTYLDARPKERVREVHLKIAEKLTDVRFGYDIPVEVLVKILKAVTADLEEGLAVDEHMQERDNTHDD